MNSPQYTPPETREEMLPGQRTEKRERRGMCNAYFAYMGIQAVATTLLILYVLCPLIRSPRTSLTSTLLPDNSFKQPGVILTENIIAGIMVLDILCRLFKYRSVGNSNLREYSRYRLSSWTASFSCCTSLSWQRCA